MHQVGGSKSQTQVAICASSEQCSMSRPEQWAIGTFRVQHDLKRSYLLYHISPALFFALRNFCHFLQGRRSDVSNMQQLGRRGGTPKNLSCDYTLFET